MGDHWWLHLSAWSFVGVFGYMDILLPPIQYRLYATVMAGGALLYIVSLFRHKPSRRDILLFGMMMLASVITVLLHFWQSYARDFQPQGRYVITLILPLAFMLAYGVDKTVIAFRGSKSGKAVELYPGAALTVLWLALFTWAAFGTMVKMLPQ